VQPGEDLSDAFAIRIKVFVEEQKVPVELEMDDIDPITDHVIVYVDGQPAATGRIVRDNPVSLGRIAVLPEYRGTGIGAIVVNQLTRKLFTEGYPEIHIHAQIQALGFYEKLGFKAYGEPYDEAGIPHRSMVKTNA